MEISIHGPWANLIIVLVLTITPMILLQLAEKSAEKSRHKEMIQALFTACCCAIILAFFILANLLTIAVEAIDLRFKKLEKSVILKAKSEKVEPENK